MHGFDAWTRCTGMLIAREKQETVCHEECMYTASCTAIALQSIHLSESPSEALHFFAHPPLPVHIFLLLQVYIE